MDHEAFEEMVRYARKVAEYEFRGWADREERVEDVVSMAWELANRYPDKPPKSQVYFAVRRVKGRRHLKESISSISHIKHRERRRSYEASPLSFNENPADIAQAMIDVEAWFSTLSPRLLQVAMLLGAGYGLPEIAQMLDLHHGHVWRLREKLRESWAEFSGE